MGGRPARSGGRGLCDRCVHQQLVPARGGVYSRCRAHERDPQIPKYPPLPVLRCHAFVAR